MDEETSVADDLRASLAELSNEPTGQEAPGGPPVTAEPPAPAAAGRDTTGRFAPRTPAANEPLPQNQQPQGQTPVAAPAPGAPAAPTAPVRAPASWKPEEREGYETLSPKHRAAIERREAEVNNVLRTTANTRQFAESMWQVIQPHMQMITSEGGTPQMAVQSMMQTAAMLRNGTPQQKAQGIANLIVQFGIPVEALDSALETTIKTRGAPPDPNLQHIMQALDQRLAPVSQFMQNFQQRQQTQSSEAVTQELDAFANDPANEFFWDVAQDVADIMELAANRGQKITLSQAYARATMAHPTISEIIANRKVGQVATQQTAAATRALNAAVSVPSSGGAPGSTSDIVDDGSVRSALLASMNELSQRR